MEVAGAMSRAFPSSAVNPQSAQPATEGTEGPEPTLWESTAAAFRVAEDTQYLSTQAPREASHYRDQLDALKALGVDTSRDGPLYKDYSSVTLPMAGSRRVVDRRAVFAKMRELNARNPAYFKGLPATQDEYDQQIATRFGARAVDQRTVQRGGITGNLVGGMSSAVTEPATQISFLFGAGQANLARTMAVESFFGAAGEAVLLPDAKRAYDAMGEKFGVREMAEQVGMGALGGAAFPLAGKGAVATARLAGKVVKPAQEAAWARILPMIPEKLRPKMTGLDDVPDGVLADVLEKSFGRDNMSPDQKAMIEVLRRADDFQSSNPYLPDAAGLEAHERGLEAAFARIAENAPMPRVTRAQGPVRPVFEMPKRQRAPVMAQSAPGEGFDPVKLKALIRRPESRGNDKAVNLAGSSASGRYQFIKSTFKSFYQRVYAATPAQANAAWTNNRFDVTVQEDLMDSLLAHNEAVLRKQGLPVNDGSMYAMHVLGEGNGPKLMRAAPDTPTSQLLSAQIIRQNAPYFKGKTAGQALGIIASKVGGPAPVASARGTASVLPRANQNGDDIAADLAVQQQSADAGAGLRAADAALAAPRAPLIGDDVMPTIRPEFRDDMPHYMDRVRASQINVDAEAFQFKSGGDEFGVTDRLRNVEKWNPGFSGRVILWESKAGGLFVADGHQRTGLAKRIGAKEGRDIELDAFVMRESDGISVGDARTYAALKNIADESGSILDMAKVLRHAGPDALRKAGVPRGVKVRHAEGVARLSDEAIGAVANDVVPQEFAGIIGARLPDDPDAHMAMINLLAKTKPANQAQADDIVRQGIAAGFVDGVQEDMFGTMDNAASLFVERAKVKDAAMVKLRAMKRIFGTAANEADTLSVAGNRINVDASKKEALGNDEALALIDKLAWSAGPVKDAIDRAARRLADGEPKERVASDLARDIRGIDLRAAAMDGADVAADEGLGSGDIDTDTLSMFDTPDAPGLLSEAKSLRHDLDMLLRDDAALDPDFKMFDDEQGAVSLADMRASIDADEAMIKTIKDCL